MIVKHPLFDVDKLCNVHHVCVSRGKPGSSSTLGGRGIREKARTCIFEGRRGALEKCFNDKRKELGSATASGSPSGHVGYKVQAHHMIPKNAYSEDNNATTYEKAYYAGWDIDNGRNCILLPKYCGWQMWERLQYHRGVHTGDYFSDIRKDLQNFAAGDFCTLADMQKLHQLFHDYEDQLFEQLKKDIDLELYPRTEIVYTNDYKDENGKHVDDADSWLAAKRRFKLAWYIGPPQAPAKSPRCPYPKTGTKYAKGIS